MRYNLTLKSRIKMMQPTNKRTVEQKNYINYKKIGRKKFGRIYFSPSYLVGFLAI